MTRWLMEAGPVIFPVLLLGAVVWLLAVVNLILLATGYRRDRRRRGIDAILFWGGVAAMLGFLGQWMAFNRMVQAVAARGIVNPQAVTYGVSESLLTPIAGMFVLLAAAGAWFLLRVGLWASDRRSR